MFRASTNNRCVPFFFLTQVSPHSLSASKEEAHHLHRNKLQKKTVVRRAHGRLRDLPPRSRPGGALEPRRREVGESDSCISCEESDGCELGGCSVGSHFKHRKTKRTQKLREVNGVYEVDHEWQLFAARARCEE